MVEPTRPIAILEETGEEVNDPEEPPLATAEQTSPTLLDVDANALPIAEPTTSTPTSSPKKLSQPTILDKINVLIVEHSFTIDLDEPTTTTTTAKPTASPTAEPTILRTTLRTTTITTAEPTVIVPLSSYMCLHRYCSCHN